MSLLSSSVGFGPFPRGIWRPNAGSARSFLYKLLSFGFPGITGSPCFPPALIVLRLSSTSSLELSLSAEWHGRQYFLTRGATSLEYVIDLPCPDARQNKHVTAIAKPANRLKFIISPALVNERIRNRNGGAQEIGRCWNRWVFPSEEHTSAEPPHPEGERTRRRRLSVIPSRFDILCPDHRIQILPSDQLPVLRRSLLQNREWRKGLFYSWHWSIRVA